MKFIRIINALPYFLHVGAYFTILSYPDLASEYEDRIMEFEAQHREDPFNEKSVQQLESICQLLETAKIFTMVDETQALPESVKCSKQDQPPTVNQLHTNSYQPLPVKIHPQFERKFSPKLFPCPYQINSEYRYFTYGFVDNLMYLYKQTDPEAEIEFLGLVEQTPSLNQSVSFDNRELERYFINAVAHRAPETASPAKLHPLCALNANQQFRLCSQIASALHQDMEVVEINYFKYHPHNCKRMQLFLREIHENGDLYPEEVFSRSVICGDPSRPTFFVILDPRREDAAFVLRNSSEFLKSKRSESQFMNVIAHVLHISVLKHAKYLY